MSDFPMFNSGEEFLQYMDQRVADIKAGRGTFLPYHAMHYPDRDEAQRSLICHRSEANRLGCDPDRVVIDAPGSRRWALGGTHPWGAVFIWTG